MDLAVYLSAAFSRQDEMKFVANELANLGIRVTSRWIIENPLATRLQRALYDVEDIKIANVLVRYSDATIDQLHTPGKMMAAKLVTGARHTETGMALMLGIPVIVIGGPQNVFDFLPQVKHLENTQQMLEYLGGQR